MFEVDDDYFIMAECIIHDKCCCIHSAFKDGDDPSGLRLNWAGTSCIGWSSVGEGARFSHESELVHATWMAQRVKLSELNLEHGFFQDCQSYVLHCLVL